MGNEKLEKVDKDNHATKLANVTFTLTNGNGKYYTLGTDSDDVNEARFLTAENTVATDSNGKITFAGLHAGEYTLTEISNPNAGYNLLTSPVTVTVAGDGTVSADGGTVQAKVITIENGKGTQLPSAGGIGTTIFYVIGAVLVIGAGVFLVTRRRMCAE